MMSEHRTIVELKAIDRCGAALTEAIHRAVVWDRGDTRITHDRELVMDVLRTFDRYGLYAYDSWAAWEVVRADLRWCGYTYGDFLGALGESEPV